MGEHFCLKWNNHQENLTGIMIKLLDEQKFVDVSLVCEMKTFKAHQTVLSACSPYFQQVLEENCHPHPIVILRDVKECEMAALLQYMYRGEVNVRDHELSTFLHTARALQIRGLSDNTKKDHTVVQRDEPMAVPTSTPSPQCIAQPPMKRRRGSVSMSEQMSNDHHSIEPMESSQLICKSSQSQKPSSSVSVSSFSDNMSDVHPYVDTSTPSSVSVKQELDGSHAQSEGPFHSLANSMTGNGSNSQRVVEGNGGNHANENQREWRLEVDANNRSYHSQKVELPKVPLPQTQSFSSQLQAPPVPELYPCSVKYKIRRDFMQQQQRPREQPGPSTSPCNQPVSVIRNAETGSETLVQRKGGRFRPGWMENFSWLQYDEGLNTMYCKTCRKWSSTVPDIRTSFVEGSKPWHIKYAFEKVEGSGFKCKICGQIKKHVRNHYLKHFPEHHECQLCRRTYTRKDNLNSHLKRDHFQRVKSASEPYHRISRQNKVHPLKCYTPDVYANVNFPPAGLGLMRGPIVPLPSQPTPLTGPMDLSLRSTSVPLHTQTPCGPTYDILPTLYRYFRN